MSYNFFRIHKADVLYPGDKKEQIAAVISNYSICIDTVTNNITSK